MFTPLDGFEAGTTKIGPPSLVSYTSRGGQLIRPGTLTGRSAVVPTTISLVAWFEYERTTFDRCEVRNVPPAGRERYRRGR